MYWKLLINQDSQDFQGSHDFQLLRLKGLLEEFNSSFTHETSETHNISKTHTKDSQGFLDSKDL